ncbi:MAG: hybrid sensor histidine kinase/response regulator [Planctomycetota bacterium]|nr:hybrid sensor histidine kinase/response regulator [Planctomycetota bacterium]
MSRGQTETILVAANDEAQRASLTEALRAAGYGVRVAGSAAEALSDYESQPAAAVVDAAAEGTLASDLRALDGDAVVVAVRATGTVAETVALMRDGVFHVLEAPVPPDHLTIVVQKALEHGRLTRGNAQLRNQLDISEKLAMIGRLASGVAHELNNPLDGVRRFIRMTQEGLETEENELRVYLERAMSGLTRMASIVRQLLTFSRNVVIENEGENLRTMLEEVVRTLQPSGHAGAVIELKNPYLDVAVPRALFQVFVNLIKNALDAVEPHGSRGRVAVTASQGDDTIEVLVEDNGVGIAPDDLRRVFEPFFTTKDVGKGTGLGLPISARIVERCGGKLSIESEPNAGTAIRVSLPLGAAASSAGVLQGAQQR